MIRRLLSLATCYVSLAAIAVAQVTIPWTDIDKTGSSLADFSTRSASDLNSGTLDNARLDADLATWAAITRASGFDAFTATPTSANLRALLTDETGTGIAYFVGGALGTPSSGTLTNATGLPVATGISGLGTGVATALAATPDATGGFLRFAGLGSVTQAYDADLASIAANATGGFLTRTAANTYTARTITGTAGQITVSNGDGAAGAPTISLPSTITQATTFSQSLSLSNGSLASGVASSSLFVGGGATNTDGGNVRVYGSTHATDANSGRLSVGASTVASWNSTGFTANLTTASTSSTTGALKVSGGLGVAGAGFFAGSLNSNSAIVTTAGAFINAASTDVEHGYRMSRPDIGTREWNITQGAESANLDLYIYFNNGGFSNLARFGTSGGITLGSLAAPTAGQVGVAYTTASTSTTTGALTVAGGMSAQGHIWGAGLNATEGTGATILNLFRTGGGAASYTANFGSARYNYITTQGAMIGSDTASDAATKSLRYGVHHYTLAEEPMGIFFVQSTSSTGDISIGGGTASFNAATAIQFFTAANNTTTTGTRRGGFNSAGDFDLTSTTNSTNPTNGAFKVAGGAGIAGNLNVGARFQAYPTGLSLLSGTGSSDYHQLGFSGAAHADGTTNVTGIKFSTIITGANDAVRMLGLFHDSSFNGSGTLTTNQTFSAGVGVSGTGSVQNGVHYGTYTPITSSGNITGSLTHYKANGVSKSSTGDVTGNITGFHAEGIGRASAITVTGFHMADATKGSGTLSGFRSSVSSGAGKWNFYADGSAANLFTGGVTVSATGSNVDGIWSATGLLNYPSIAAATSADLTITVTGASTGDSVSIGLPAAPTDGIIFQGFVSAANTVTVRATNITGTPVDPASATYRATVTSF